MKKLIIRRKASNVQPSPNGGRCIDCGNPASYSKLFCSVLCSIKHHDELERLENKAILWDVKKVESHIVTGYKGE